MLQHPYTRLWIWTPKVGDEGLYLKCEDDSERNKYAVAVMIGGCTGRHAPKSLSKIFNHFLLFLTVPSNVKSLGSVVTEELDMD